MNWLHVVLDGVHWQSFEHYNESSSSIRGGNFVDGLSDWLFCQEGHRSMHLFISIYVCLVINNNWFFKINIANEITEYYEVINEHKILI